MIPQTNIQDIEKNPFSYVWLRRKRRFILDGFDSSDTDIYSCEPSEQSEYTVVFSPDRLETEYPFYHVHVKNLKNKSIVHETYKHEYFTLMDNKVQESLKPEDLDTIDILLSKFIREPENWLMQSKNFES